LSLLFFAVGSLAVPHVVNLPLFSGPSLVSLALPAFILLAGVFNLVRSAYAPVVTFFVSFLAAVNSLAVMFTGEPPYFLDQSAPPMLVSFFHYVLPAAAIVYFALHSLCGFFQWKKMKTAEGEAAAAPRPPSGERYCANCQARLSEEDEMCPSCGALIRGLRCAGCGYEGRQDDFRDGRCPRCGRELDADA
jgi:hypothetical protein